MIKTINIYDFDKAFKDMGRENQFSALGRKKLFEYLEEYEESTGESVELDVIALCCEYVEYESLDELKQAYDHEGDFDEVMDELENNTTVISKEEDCILIQQY